jgi:two-component system OmpR family response regulator
MSQIKTIFIVDDDPTQAMMLQDYLEKFPAFTIHTFHSGEDCIKNMGLNPQIIFLDYNFDLAGKDAMDGIDILKEIKRLNPDTEVVMFSGQDKIEVAVNTMKYGAFDYIVKNESAFHRSENVIFNIIKRLKIAGEAKLYKRLTLLLAVALGAVLILATVLYNAGLIKDLPGWW